MNTTKTPFIGQTEKLSISEFMKLRVQILNLLSNSRVVGQKIKNIATWLVGEIQRKLPENHPYSPQINIFKKVLQQGKASKHKIYSLHEPQVQCVCKGKDHKKYEFGNKVSILYTQNTGMIVGALSFGNPYDGHTLKTALEQYERLLRKVPASVTVDRGDKGKAKIDNTPNTNTQTIFQKTHPVSKTQTEKIIPQ